MLFKKGDRIFWEERLTLDVRRIIEIKEIIYSGRSQFQKIEIYKTDTFGKMLVLDDVIQFATSDEAVFHENFVHPPFFFRENIENVLVFGGGDGGCAREALKHEEVRSLDLVELDEEIFKVCKKYIPEVMGGIYNDTRLNTIFTDGLKFIEKNINQNKKYDLIVLDVTDPSEESKFLYTVEFFQKLKSVLSEKGIIAVHSNGIEMEHIYAASIIKTLRNVFKNVHYFSRFIPSFALTWEFIFASEVEFDKKEFLTMANNSKIEFKSFYPEIVTVFSPLKEKFIKKYGKLITFDTTLKFFQPETDGIFTS